MAELNVEYFDEAGMCPLDHMPAAVLNFTKADPGADLLPVWARHMVRVCPLCLTASTEHDFMSEHAPAQDNSLSVRLQSPYSRIRDAFVQTLPARLNLAARRLYECPDAARQDWLNTRHDRMVERGEMTLALLAPAMPHSKLRMLSGHMVSLLADRRDIAPMMHKLAGVHLPADSPLTGMLQRGAATEDLLQGAIYGALAAQGNARELQLKTVATDAPDTFAPHLLQLQAQLDRFTIYTLFLYNRTALWEDLVKSGRIRQTDVFEQTARQELQDYRQDQKQKKEHHLLAMGRNYYHLARMLHRQGDSPAPAWRTVAGDALIESAQYLEASLLTEPYPEFEPEDTVYFLNKHGRIKVPFFFGAPGVRLMLCHLYLDIYRAGLTMPGPSPAEAITAHWTAAHELFHKLDFGRLEDPTAVQLLIPRLIHFARQCPLPEAADRLNQLIERHSDTLYGRYLEPAGALPS